MRPLRAKPTLVEHRKPLDRQPFSRLREKVALAPDESGERSEPAVAFA